jgi:hypothetical protein
MSKIAPSIIVIVNNCTNLSLIEQTLSQWKITFPINDLHDIIPQPNSELTIENKVKFRNRGGEPVGSVIVNSDNENDAAKEAQSLIDKALEKICFAYNTEASIDKSGRYVIDLSNDPNKELISKSLHMRWSHVKEDPQITLLNIASLNSDKLEVLDLALAYYKLGEYANPLRIESFFSCMTTIVRSLHGRDHITTSALKGEIIEILKRTNNDFSELAFEEDWKSFYVEERCSIAHGKGSKLIDVRTSSEYDKIVDTVRYWATTVLYYYIDNYKNEA